jgi:flagellar biosynthetic protein FliQ
MTPDTVMDIGQKALEVTVLLAAPPLLAALVVGLIISMFQAATQINEMTLAFVPKLIVLVAVMIFAGPWMLAVITDYTQQLFEAIPGLIG